MPVIQLLRTAGISMLIQIAAWRHSHLNRKLKTLESNIISLSSRHCVDKDTHLMPESVSMPFICLLNLSLIYDK